MLGLEGGRIGFLRACPGASIGYVKGPPCESFRVILEDVHDIVVVLLHQERLAR